jgi:hypothetical protein
VHSVVVLGASSEGPHPLLGSAVITSWSPTVVLGWLGVTGGHIFYIHLTVWTGAAEGQGLVVRGFIAWVMTQKEVTGEDAACSVGYNVAGSHS